MNQKSKFEIDTTGSEIFNLSSDSENLNKKMEDLEAFLFSEDYIKPDLDIWCFAT